MSSCLSLCPCRGGHVSVGADVAVRSCSSSAGGSHARVCGRVCLCSCHCIEMGVCIRVCMHVCMHVCLCGVRMRACACVRAGVRVRVWVPVFILLIMSACANMCVHMDVWHAQADTSATVRCASVRMRTAHINLQCSKCMAICPDYHPWATASTGFLSQMHEIQSEDRDTTEN